MKRRVIGVIVAVALAATGTAALVAYVNAAEDRALAGEEVVDVLVVSEPVEKGTPAADLEGSVTAERVPEKVRADDAVSDLDDLGDRVAAIALVPGEQLVADRFAAPAEVETLGQGVDVPDGMLQVSVALAPERTVGGRLEPGTTVGVLASFSESASQPATTGYIRHKALVTAVQGDVAASDEEDSDETPSENVMVTLALTAPEAERLVHAAEFGSVWLAFEPQDAPEDGAAIITRAEVYP